MSISRGKQPIVLQTRCRRSKQLFCGDVDRYLDHITRKVGAKPYQVVLYIGYLFLKNRHGVSRYLDELPMETCKMDNLEHKQS